MNRVDDAFKAMDRTNFVAPGYESAAYVDAPLPIGYGQTISQPTTVRYMLEWLDAKPGHKLLDVGSGSGWTSALLAHIVGPQGKVFAVERIPQLIEFGRRNNERLGIKNVQFFEAGKTFGLPKHALYDRILVSAAANKLPEELIDQLKVSGRLVVPVKHDILVINKISKDKYQTDTYHGFAFVPIVK